MLPSPVVANLEALTAPCSWNPAATTDENNLNANNENSSTAMTTTGSNLGGGSNNVNAKGKSLWPADRVVDPLRTELFFAIL